MSISKRAFVSFDEPCYYDCKHCYTYGIKRSQARTTDEIISSISEEQFDVIYVSQKNDNFSQQKRGISLCEQLFSRYNTNIFIITRSVFSEESIRQIEKLKDNMGAYDKELFIAISLNSLNSYGICENVAKVPTPQERIDFIAKLSESNFRPILMLRPIFPDSIIPIEECLQIIDQVKDNISCVVSSELGINENVLSRLGMKESDFNLSDNQEYLQGAIDCDIKFIDVSNEIKIISDKCEHLGINIFKHSMTALNFLANSNRIK